MMLLMAVWWHVWSGTISDDHPVRLEAERLAATIDDHPLARLHDPAYKLQDYKLSETFRLYLGKLAPLMPPGGLATFIRNGQPVYVIARDDERYARALSEAGFAHVDTYHLDKNVVEMLWRSP